MKLLSYSEALKMGKEKLQECLIPVKVNKARKQAELEMCKIDESIATKQAKLHDVCGSEEVDFKKIISLQNDIALEERTRTQYEQILKEMFPE